MRTVMRLEHDEVQACFEGQAHFHRQQRRLLDAYQARGHHARGVARPLAT